MSSNEISQRNMPMFDRLFFEAELPTDNLPEEIKDQDMSELEFQTHDLYKEMDTWSVSTAGELFLHEVEQNIVNGKDSSEGFILEEKPLGIKKVEETKSVHFYRVFECKDLDYWVSFDALFHKGKLVLVELNEINEIDKEQRKEAKIKADKFMESYKERQERKTHAILKPVKLLLGLFLVALHWVGKSISGIHSKL